MMRRIILALCLMALPQVALADPKDDARRHFRAGLTAANELQYEISLQHFLAAQEAYPHPATLYNIARAYTDLNDIPNALTYYHLYRDAAPEKAADIDPVIAALEERQGGGRQPVGEGTAVGVFNVAGPTAEELARLQAISEELQALAGTI
ncbi:MAG: hypothetical protein HN348_03680, partial [Proteobacteria bacterium]|nr:hypothetical protein [Pseudomonadota bacterium]